MARTLSVQEVLHKVKGGNRQKKGVPRPKKTPCWLRYKNEQRAYHHQVKRIEKHVAKNPNDKPAASALTRIRNQRYGG